MGMQCERMSTLHAQNIWVCDSCASHAWCPQEAGADTDSWCPSGDEIRSVWSDVPAYELMPVDIGIYLWEQRYVHQVASDPLQLRVTFRLPEACQPRMRQYQVMHEKLFPAPKINQCFSVCCPRGCPRGSHGKVCR